MHMCWWKKKRRTRMVECKEERRRLHLVKDCRFYVLCKARWERVFREENFLCPKKIPQGSLSSTTTTTTILSFLSWFSACLLKELVQRIFIIFTRLKLKNFLLHGFKITCTYILNACSLWLTFFPKLFKQHAEENHLSYK